MEPAELVMMEALAPTGPQPQDRMEATAVVAVAQLAHQRLVQMELYQLAERGEELTVEVGELSITQAEPEATGP